MRNRKFEKFKILNIGWKKSYNLKMCKNILERQVIYLKFGSVMVKWYYYKTNFSDKISSTLKTNNKRNMQTVKVHNPNNIFQQQ